MTTEPSNEDAFSALVGSLGDSLGPTGAIGTYATYLHEFYDSLIKAGFSEDNAIGMTAQMMTTQQTIVMQMVVTQMLQRRADGG